MKRADIQKRLKSYLPQSQDQFDRDLQSEEESDTPQTQKILTNNRMGRIAQNKKKNRKTIVISDDDDMPVQPFQAFPQQKKSKLSIRDDEDEEIVNYMENKLGIKQKVAVQQEQDWKWVPQPIIPQKKKKHIHEFAPYIMLPGDVWPPNYFNRSYDPLRREIAQKRRNI